MFRNQKVIPNRIFQSLRNRLRSQPAQRSYLGALRDGDGEAAVVLVDEAIRREVPKVMTTKGMMYALGRAEVHDPESAYLWFLQAANRGSPEAMVAKGICYASGEGTARDLSSAAFWLHRAAKLGYPFGTAGDGGGGPRRLRPRDRHRPRAGLPLQQAEMSTFGYDHADVGAALAQRWNFPEDIRQALAFHHAPSSGTPGGPAALIHYADAIAKALDLDGAEDTQLPHLDPASIDALDLDQHTLARVLAETQAGFDHCSLLLG